MVATPETVENNSRSPQVGDRVAVLLMGYGEVESYEDFANYNEQALNLLTAKFAPVPTWIYPPLAKLLALFDFHEWNHQHDNFISPHNAIFEKQREGIEKALQQRWGDRVEVFKAFNFCAPFLPEQVLAEIQQQGFQKLLIYPLLVVDSIFTSGIAVEQVNKALDRLADQDSGQSPIQSMRYIPSFYNEPDYIALMAQLVEETIAAELRGDYLPSEIGIVLMNHGCPHKAKGFTSGIRESEALYESVREQLIYRYPLISVGWLNHQTPLIEWTQPNAHLAAENLIQLGAKAIVFMPIGFATENHETLLDVHHIIHALEARHDRVRYVQMACVNEHPQFLQMAAEWAHPQIEALLAETEVSAVSASHSRTHARGHTHNHTHSHAH
ncbi:ferrochelatase [Oxynema aestuarii]|nr:ferrochelatase [Oxynema aestuarii]